MTLHPQQPHSPCTPQAVLQLHGQEVNHLTMEARGLLRNNQVPVGYLK